MKRTLTPKVRGPGRKPKLAGGPAHVVAIRMYGADHELIKRAAAIDRRTVSQFLAVAGIERAERLLADQTKDKADA